MKTDPASFSVMTMNLRFGLARDGENRWNNRKALVGAFLKPLKFDFIGFQEVNHFQADFLETTLKEYRHIGWYNRKLPWWQSNMIFFHKDWNCLGHRHQFISRFPDIPSKMTGSRWPRQCVVGWFENQGRSVLAANTHFDFNPAVQARSAGMVIAFVKRFPPGLPVVITGDFNAGHDSSAFHTFQAHGFREVFEAAPPGTFHGFTGKADSRHIDWILYRGNIRPGTPRVMTFHKGTRYPSDHFPVAADFTWTQDRLTGPGALPSFPVPDLRTTHALIPGRS
jgi:endonuclease/exonuclease/phosphatase family metal-dependent hydrolase